VLTTVTITLSKVVVEQPQPRVLVRNSKRSWLAGHMSALKTGSRRLVAGTQIPLYIIWSAKTTRGVSVSVDKHSSVAMMPRLQQHRDCTA
jgi:hypothetical protein